MMIALKLEFDAQANLSYIAGDIDSAMAESDGNNDGSTSESSDLSTLTMEYSDNPFASLIRKIESLSATDPVSAYYLILSAKSDGIFKMDKQIEALEAKQEEIIHKIKLDVSAHNNEKEGLSVLFCEQAVAAPSADAAPKTPQEAFALNAPAQNYRPMVQFPSM